MGKREKSAGRSRRNPGEDLQDPVVAGVHGKIGGVAKQKGISLEVFRTPPTVYEAKLKKHYKYKDYSLHDSATALIRVGGGGEISEESIEGALEAVKELSGRSDGIEGGLYRILALEDRHYVKSVSPKSHWMAENCDVESVDFRVVFEDSVAPSGEKEEIGEAIYNFSRISSCGGGEDPVLEDYERLKVDALAELRLKEAREFFAGNAAFAGMLRGVKEHAEKRGARFLPWGCGDGFAVLDDMNAIFEYTADVDDLEAGLDPARLAGVAEAAGRRIDTYFAKKREIKRCVDKINRCRNGRWKAVCAVLGWGDEPKARVYIDFYLSKYECVSGKIEFRMCAPDDGLGSVEERMAECMEGILGSLESRGARVMELAGNPAGGAPWKAGVA